MKSISPVLSIMLMLMLPSLCIGAESWEPIAISADHSAWLFVDRQSIKRSQNVSTVRVMTEYEEDQRGIAETGYLSYVIVRNLLRVDCAKRQVQALEEEYLDSSDTFLGGKDVTKEPWEAIERGSLIESAFVLVCRKGKPMELTQNANGQRRPHGS